MMFHESALADLDGSLEERPVFASTVNARLLFERGPRHLLCLGGGSEPDGGSVPTTDERQQPIPSGLRGGSIRDHAAAQAAS